MTVALCAVAGSAHAQANPFDTYLNAAVRLYESLDYEAALEQLEKAKKLSRGVDDDAQLFLYEGVFRMDLGQSEQAKQAFKTGLLLKPDAALQVKVSPKVRAEVEKIREQVKKELAPMLAKQEAERMKKAEDERKAEEQRKLDAARAAAAEASRVRDEEAKRRAAEEAAKQKQLDAQKQPPGDKPPTVHLTDAQRVELVPKDHPPDGVTAPPPKARKFPVVPLIFLGVGAAAGGTGAYFGVQSRQAVTDARAALFQDDVQRKLTQAQTNATVANVLFCTAAAAGIGALIGFIVGTVGDSGEATP